MADAALQKAMQYLADPDLSESDRKELLAAFPQLAQQNEPPEQPAVQLPEHPIAMQQPTSNAGIAPVQPAFSGAKQDDISYDSLLAKEEARQQDIRDRDERLRSFTKRTSLYADPVVEAPIPQTLGVGTQQGSTLPTRAYYHYEPSVEQAMKWAAKTNNTAAYKSLKEKGEESDYYKRYADIQWQKVSSKFKETGESAVRVQLLDPQTALQWFDKANSWAQGKAVSLLGGWDDAVFMGAGKQALASMGAPFQAVQELEKEGVIPPTAERIKSMQSANPVTAIVGTGLGMATPGIGEWLVSAGNAAVKGGGTIARYGVPAVEGALFAGGTGAVEKVGADLRGEESKDWADVIEQAGEGAVMGEVLGGGAELIGKIGTARSTAVRENPQYRNIIQNAERGDVDVRGGTTSKPLSGGFKPNKIYVQRATELAKKEQQAVKNKKPIPADNDPATSLAQDIQGDMRNILSSKTNAIKANIKAREDAYFDATDHLKESTEPLANSIIESIQNLKTKKIPGLFESEENIAFAGKKVKALENILEQLRVVSQEPVEDIGNLNIDPHVQRWLASMGVKSTGGNTVYGWASYSPRELQTAVKSLDELIDVETNKTANKKIPEYLANIQLELRNIRDKFPANEAAPETLVETVRIGNETKTIKGGLSALTAWGKRQSDEIDNWETAMNLRNAAPGDSLAQEQAAIAAAKQYGSEGHKPADEAMQRLFAGNPKILRTLDAIASGQAVDQYRHGGSMAVGRVNPGQAMGLGITASIGNILGPYSDPIYMTMSRLQDKGPVIGGIAGIRDRDIIPAAELAMRTVLDTGVATCDAIQLLYNTHKENRDKPEMEKIRQQLEKTEKTR